LWQVRVSAKPDERSCYDAVATVADEFQEGSTPISEPVPVMKRALGVLAV